MKIIWKYPLLIADEQIVNLPKNAQILCIQNQKENPCLWALVLSENKIESRTIICRGTGHPINEPYHTIKYIDSIQLINGDIIFHYFEKLPL